MLGFIHEFKIRTENSRLSELGVENGDVARVSIDFREVDSIWENKHDETGEKNTSICLKSGTDYIVLESYESVLSVWKKVIC